MKEHEWLILEKIKIYAEQAIEFKKGIVLKNFLTIPKP